MAAPWSPWHGPDMLLVTLLTIVFAVVVWLIMAQRDIVRAGHNRWPLFAKPLLTEREAEFYRRLDAIYPGHRIFVQVALSQLIDVVPGTNNRRAIRNQFQQLVADFVLCRPDWSVVAVIELDDASHRRADRQYADERKRKAVESAGLRLIRIPAGPIPPEAEIQQIVEPTDASLPMITPSRADARPLIDPETTALLRPVLNVVLVSLMVVGIWAVASRAPEALRKTPEVPLRAAAPVAVTKPLATVPTPVDLQATKAAEQKRSDAAQALAAHMAADNLARRKQAAWAEFYQPPTSCEHPPAWQDQVECGNQYIRAKREFEQRWAAQANLTSAP